MSWDVVRKSNFIRKWDWGQRVPFLRKVIRMSLIVDAVEFLMKNGLISLHAWIASGMDCYD